MARSFAGGDIMRVLNKSAACIALATAFVVGGLLGTAPANADTFFDLTFTQVGTPGNGCCGPFDVSANLDATPIGLSGNFNIVGISGTVTENGTPYSITGLISPPSDPGGYFGFNNIIYNGASYKFDTGGVGFYAAGGLNYYPADPSTAYNVYDNGYPNAQLSTTASYDVNTPFNGTYSITEITSGSSSATPLPAALPLFATGLGALGLLGWRRKRKAAAIATA
jgi:hypothetical protein